MAEPEPEQSGPGSMYAVYMRLALAPWTMYFLNEKSVERRTMELADSKICTTMVQKTARKAEVREALGYDVKFWRDMTSLFDAAVPSFERRCFNAPDPAATDYDSAYDTASGILIARNSDSLSQDLHRLHKLVLVATNVLNVGEGAQNLCSTNDLDKAIFRLISVCVKVTARGFDGDAGSPDEEKWQGVVNMFKVLLVGTLKFLNNLTALNERRKMNLWCQLFDTPDPGPPYPEPPVSEATGMQLEPQQPPKSWPTDPVQELTEAVASLQGPEQRPVSSPFLLFVAKKSIELKKRSEMAGIHMGMQELTQECLKQWKELSEEDRKYWGSVYDSVMSLYQNAAFDPQAKGDAVKHKDLLIQHFQNVVKAQEDPLAFSESTPYKPEDPLSFPEVLSELSASPKSRPTSSKTPASRLLPESFHYNYPDIYASEPAPAVEADYRVSFTAEHGAEILQRGKEDLMKRLCNWPDPRPLAPLASDVVSPASPPAEPASIDNISKDDPAAVMQYLQGESAAPMHADDAGSVEAALDELSDEGSESDDSYVVPGDDGRGLLTDVPLILGPSEIEVLPMLILSGIVPPTKPEMPGHKSDPIEMASIRNMHTVRCQLLLSQDNGKNLLRELLIFVAAWDLREDELYFKFMAKIMEAILQDGLMPLAYHEFRENKDIISPAQAVILKLLTAIFRSRQASIKASPQGTPNNAVKPSPPLRVEIHTLSFLLTEFRRNIIPQTCALIFLQGQTRMGMANPEDFPLNLWDMERMYEGVYQYLEFFAILTEGEAWKTMMAEWDIASELVTLLIELDGAIPKAGLVPSNANRRMREQALAPPLPSDPAFAPPVPPLPTQPASNALPQSATPPVNTIPHPVAVERPYDTLVPPAPAATPYPPTPNAPYPPSTHSEPADFEWRNLKKLTILVLSSLIWRSALVQQQVREHGGIEAILNCCNHDEHNPYIREHAIMCLRFLMEGNKDNQEVVRQLEAREPVPSEVLDQGGYETFLDGRGRVGLRKKENRGVVQTQAAVKK